MDNIVNVAFVLVVVAFLKQQLALKNKYVILGASFAVVLVAAFLPDLIAAFPQYQDAVNKLVDVIKVFVSAAGSYDLFVDLKNKPAG